MNHTRLYKVLVSQVNHSQIPTTITNHSLFIEIVFAEDPRTEETHKNFHKTDIVDQTVKITNIAIITQDQTQIEVIIRTIIEIFLIQTLGTDTILKIVQEIHHKIEIKIIQTMETEFILIVYHETTLTINHIITITVIDPVITPGIETITAQIDRETILSHHKETTLNIQIHIVKTTEIHTNIKDKIIKHSQWKTHNQTLRVLTKQKTWNYSCITFFVNT